VTDEGCHLALFDALLLEGVGEGVSEAVEVFAWALIVQA
jgi:hypothetical protein